MSRQATSAILDQPTWNILGRLDEHGYHIARGLLAAETIEMFDRDLASTFASTPFGRGGFYGETTKRFGRLLARSSLAPTLVQHPRVLAVVETLLAPFCDCVQLNVAQAIGIYPGAPAQLPHRDQDMWRATPGAMEYLVNVIWPLTPFRADNGATLVWPGSHRTLGADGVRGVPCAAEMEPGDALIFLGSTLHGAGSNRSATPRRGVVIGYSLGWLKPYENQWLAYPPETARTFSPELAALVGYCQHRPNLGNFEGQCPSVLLREDHDVPRGAIDALRPDQEESVAEFLTVQRQQP